MKMLFFPNQGSKYLNPCDNSVNSAIRRVYSQQARHTHAEMITAIDRAYGQVPDSTIVSSFLRTGLLTTQCAARTVHRLMQQGFLPHELHREEIMEKILTYRRWKKTLRYPSRVAGREPIPKQELQALVYKLNGAYWRGFSRCSGSNQENST